MRETIDTTYADLRPTDLVIDKSGQAWPIAELRPNFTGQQPASPSFWLCDPVTSVKMHHMVKLSTDAVKVSRLPTQADEASKLEADFPVTNHHFEAFDGSSGMVCTKLVTDAQGFGTDCGRPASEHAAEEADFPKSSAPEGAGVPPTVSATTETPQESTTETTGFSEIPAGDNFVSMAEAVAAVEDIGGTVEAEVTADEVDVAAAATDDAPVSLPPFADMTPLEQRSHLYLLHGCYSHDTQSRDTLSTWHNKLHSPEGTVKSKTVPHVHAASMDAKNRG